VRSFAWYTGTVVSPILTLKYRPNQALARALALGMSEVVTKARWTLDRVTAVPLGPARFKQRGYNQAGLLAAALASELSLEFIPQALVRRRETASQVGLDRRGRMENVDHAFRALPNEVQGCNILVVDDLLTSGATLSTCASALKQAGAKTVFGVTAARAHRTV
jgi:ComF family protein